MGMKGAGHEKKGRYRIIPHAGYQGKKKSCGGQKKKKIIYEYCKHSPTKS